MVGARCARRVELGPDVRVRLRQQRTRRQRPMAAEHTVGPAWFSGGTTGPGGSILSLPAMALLAWIALRTLPNPVSPAPTDRP